MEYIKGIFCFTTFTSWAYAAAGIIGIYAGNGTPDWFPAAAAAAVITFFVTVGICVYDVLKDGMPQYVSRRARRRSGRCLGMVRYVDGEWITVREHAKED